MLSATRAACCMLCVTMTMVHWSLIATSRSSIFAVAIGIERGTGLVEQQHFGIHRQPARDAKALLLAAGKRVGGFVQLVLHFIPKRGAAQALFHDAPAVRNGWPDR